MKHRRARSHIFREVAGYIYKIKYRYFIQPNKWALDILNELFYRVPSVLFLYNAPNHVCTDNYTEIEVNKRNHL